MDELSLHILDIAQNSIVANSTLVEIIITENTFDNLYTIIIKDDGNGMTKDVVEIVSDPFYTTRRTRKVGMGLSLFKMAAELTGGSFQIDSLVNVGTSVRAQFTNDHIDRAPLGNIVDTLCILVLNEQNIDIYYEHNYNDQQFIFDTRTVKEILDGVSFSDNSVLEWIKQYIKEGINTMYKEENK